MLGFSLNLLNQAVDGTMVEPMPGDRVESRESGAHSRHYGCCKEGENEDGQQSPGPRLLRNDMATLPEFY